MPLPILDLSDHTPQALRRAYRCASIVGSINNIDIVRENIADLKPETLRALLALAANNPQPQPNDA